MPPSAVKAINHKSKRLTFEAKIIIIATREAGSNGILGLTKIGDVFVDSLEWLEFMQTLAREIGPLSEADMLKCETFSDIAEAYALSS